MILVSALLLLVQKATGDAISTFGGLITPFNDDWWRILTAPFAYVDVGYLFVIAVAVAIFGTGLERRLGTPSTAILLIACGSLGMLAATGIANAQGNIEVIAGGNGIALGAVAAWFALRRAETQGAIDQDYDKIGVAVAAVVLLALPIFESTANVYRRPRRRRGRRPRRVADGRPAAEPLRWSRATSQLEAAIEQLTDSERFAEAERIVSRAAPQLQKVLASALADGGWFGESHQLRGAEGGDHARRRGADRRRQLAARRRGEDVDAGRCRGRLGAASRAQRFQSPRRGLKRWRSSSTASRASS